MPREHDKQSKFSPSHLGTKPVEYKRNKGKKMHDKSGETPIIMQTKGE
ncbi:acid-soluble spore protein N [Bacillus haynesii]|nr:acid-soluble spore protein N [Bacillus haynesii]MCY9218227.1 acid-soluble spore protein N [Bacillus haynesii]MCY9287357.1 acid-soluble spore protein N [Bacillus haynesii]MEC0720627.1 acid-soluble spore protein N [Bacillus haynesii]